MKRTGVSKKTNKQYNYYCCEHRSAKDESSRCDFMTWDVPVKDDCPVCGQTMFKRSGRGFKRPYCINPACSNFLPEDQRGYPKKKTDGDGTEPPETEEAPAKKSAAAKKTTAAKKTATAKKTAAAKKPAAAKKTAAATKKATTTKKTTTTKTTAAKKTAAAKETTDESGD